MRKFIAKEVFQIFRETHKIIVSNVYNDVSNTYEVQLDKDKLIWGAITPDILPQYKMHRHYQKESLNYIVNEIQRLILLGKYIKFDSGIDTITLKYISKKIGLISHYLSDFVCLPHAQRWTFADNMIKHISYESKLNEYASNYTFNNVVINKENIDISSDGRKVKFKYALKKYIEGVIKEYSKYEEYARDLDFSYSLSLKMAYFIIDMINSYNEEVLENFVFES